MNIYYDITGQRRKELVKALSEVTLWEAKYLGAPDFYYRVGNYMVSKNGTISCPPDAPTEILWKLVNNLEKRGFVPTWSELDLIIIALPRKDYDDAAITRLKNLAKSKEKLLKAALGSRELQIEVDDEKIYFPWFMNHGIDGEVLAYQQLVSLLGLTAKEQKRISPIEKPQDNLKYAMRLFLVRLGFIGDEYKQSRKILLRNLSGNSSWRSGHVPERHISAPSEAEVITHEK